MWIKKKTRQMEQKTGLLDGFIGIFWSSEGAGINHYCAYVYGVLRPLKSRLKVSFENEAIQAIAKL